MTLCYCTNIWNHHQGEVCRSLAKKLGDDFKMCLFQPLNHHWSVERIQNGWNLTPPDESFIMGPPDYDNRLDEMMRTIYAADVIVVGFTPFLPKDFHDNRIKAGKLTLVMGERFFKQKITPLSFLNPRFIKRIWHLHRRLNYRNVHYLTMSHYCADDLKFLQVCKNRTWTWGYLTNVPETAPVTRDNGKTRIMWCGRMLDWKQVDHFLQALKQVVDTGCEDIEVDIIGGGEEENNLKTLATTLELNKWVNFAPFMPKDTIRKKMRVTDIYIFPSNRKEGWGAVLSEAMSEGCVVIANREAGATLELVQHGKNGFVYENGNIHELASLIKYCCEKPEKRRLLGLEAWKTMRNWSPEEGANRLIQLTSKLTAGGSPFIYESGLCSSKQKG